MYYNNNLTISSPASIYNYTCTGYQNLLKNLVFWIRQRNLTVREALHVPSLKSSPMNQSGKPYWSDLGDLALVLPLKLVDLLREKPRLGARHEGGLAATPNKQVWAAVKQEHLAVVQGLPHGLDLVPEWDTRHGTRLHVHIHVHTYTGGSIHCPSAYIHVFWRTYVLLTNVHVYTLGNNIILMYMHIRKQRIICI